MPVQPGGAPSAPPILARIVRAAVVLGAAALLASASSCTAEAPRSGAPQSAPRPISPRGPATWPIVFSWEAQAGGPWVYRVTVVDAADRTLTEQDARGTRAQAPPELEGMLGGRGPFSWRVGIVREDGSVTAVSDPVEFSLK